ncbi:MAG TPA: amino acid permease [Acidobacteriota bacterium]|nr:amino acid permease [Acidobacteriota bacterium]
MSSPDPTNEGLVRNLGMLAASAFVVTNMVGTGIFTLPAFVRVAAGSAPAALGVWLAAGLLGLCGALCYAELATRMPGAGGEYRYLARVFGPLWGFLSGWTSFIVGFSAAVAASALGMTAYLAPLIPGWEADALLIANLGITQGAVLASIIVLVLTLVHSVGVRSSGRFQTTLASIVVAAIVLFVLVGVANGRGDWDGLRAAGVARGSWWAALLPVSYAYAGWNAAAYMAGEVRCPGTNLPRAIIGGAVAVTVLYLAVNALFFYAIPEADWEPVIAVGQLAASRLLGDAGSLVVSAIIAMAMFGSVSAMTAVGPRIYFAMARDGLAPHLLGRLSESGRVPVIAIVAQGVLAALLALTGAFEALLIYIGSSLLLFNALTILTLFVVRWRGEAAPPGAFVAPGHPVPGLIFVVITIAAWGQGLISTPIPTTAALATLFAGALVYGLARRWNWLANAAA